MYLHPIFIRTYPPCILVFLQFIHGCFRCLVGNKHYQYSSWIIAGDVVPEKSLENQKNLTLTEFPCIKFDWESFLFSKEIVTHYSLARRAETYQPRATPCGMWYAQNWALKRRDIKEFHWHKSISIIMNDMCGINGYVTPFQGWIYRGCFNTRALPWAGM